MFVQEFKDRRSKVCKWFKEGKVFDEMFERISTTIQGRLKFGQVFIWNYQGFNAFWYMYINCCDQPWVLESKRARGFLLKYSSPKNVRLLLPIVQSSLLSNHHQLSLKNNYIFPKLFVVSHVLSIYFGIDNLCKKMKSWPGKRWGLE